MKTFSVGIVIVTYNSAYTIESCLDSIATIQYPDIKVMVVDNSPNDRTRNIIHKKYKNTALLKNKINVGFAAANNQGISHLLKKGCRFILLLNPDTEVKPNVVDYLLKAFDEQNVGISGCAITYHGTQKIWFAGGIFNNYFCYTNHKKMNRYISSLDQKTRDTDFITGCCMMIRSDVFKKIGYLDASFGFYFEDVDFCLRAKEAGFISKIIEKPLVSHRVSSSSGVQGSNRLTAFKAFYYGRNPFYLIKKHFHGWRKVPAVFGQFFIRLPFQGVRMIQQRDFHALFEYVQGMKEGIMELVA